MFLSHRRIVAPALLAVAVTLSACAGSTAEPGAGAAATTRGAAPAGLRTVDVAMTASGCAAPHASYPSGPLTFRVSNTDATAVSEFEILSGDRILGEKENLAPGFSGTFSLDLPPGRYALYCPGAASERSNLTVTGTATTAAASSTKALLQQGAAGYLGYVKIQIKTLTTSVAGLDQAIRSGNLRAAQDAYGVARRPYERIEPVAESFPDLDPAIDARADDIAPTKLTGFHRLEYGLFHQRSLRGLAPVSAGLVGNVAKLSRLVDALPAFQPAELANGAVGLLDEAAKSKITGEEERYAHVDLVDFAANLEGSQQAFAYLEDGLKRIDATLVATIRSAFGRVSAELDRFKDADQPTGYRLYGQLSNTDLRAVAQALQAVAEPLSRVAGKIVAA